MNRPLRDYTAYGLHVRSSVALPFTPVPDPSDAEPDVTVRIGATPAALPSPAKKPKRWETAPGAFLLNVDGVARYMVTDGRDVLVEPRGGSDNDLSVFLTAKVFAALLQQRGVVTLHASAVETETGAVLFAGRSGSGKSTLLAALAERGYAMLSDDITGVVLDAGNRPTALSAIPGIRLWADALDEMGWRPRARRVRAGMEKYVTPAARFRSAPQVVRAVYLLAQWDRQEVATEPVPVGSAFQGLWRATYRWRFLHGMGRQPEHFRTVSAMARSVPVFRVMRPAHPFRLAALADRVEEDLQQARASPAEKAPQAEHTAPLPASAG